jgi:hypothetical protein
MERLKDEYCSTEHLLVAIAQDAEGPAGRILRQAGVTKDGIYRALVDVRGSQRVSDQNPEAKYQALERYSRDLTELARKGKLDPVIGRDEEIRRVVQVLSRRTKNNPVLIGRPASARPRSSRARPAQSRRVTSRRAWGASGWLPRPGPPAPAEALRRVRDWLRLSSG